MFIKKVTLKDDINKDSYPYNIKALKSFTELNFSLPVTFFTGENGSGKSTILEGLAVLSGLNAEGGSNNFNFRTKDTHSSLYKGLIVSKDVSRPKTKYFLRAESFYNVASEIERLDDGPFPLVDAYGGKSLHEQSHGESFINIVENRFYSNGLYFLDEPEAALSPLKQMRLLVLIDELVKNGSQFIIATHSPILLAYPNSKIIDFDNNLKEVEYKETENYKLYKLFIENPDLMIRNLLENND